MEHPQQPPDATLQQRFRDLTEQLHRVHESWQEAYRQHDVARQMDLIDREHALIGQLQDILAALQQDLQERLVRQRRPPERTP